MAETIRTADPDRPCYHPEFEAFVNVGRVGEGDDANPTPGMPKYFMADITVSCAACGEHFVFEGVPAGHSFTAPAVSVDGRELRAPMRPQSSPPSFPRAGGGIIGFGVSLPLPDDPGRPGDG